MSLSPTPLDWTPEGAPRSTLFDDIYFQPGEGLAESRAVFIEGCGLPDAWRGRRRFVVGELGFGAGLNILALLDLWSRTREAGQRLHVFSVEAYPLRVEDARRALAPWPELAEIAELMLSQWPRRSRGPHRLDLPQLDAVVDVVVADAAEALADWTGQADAWFLDGFAPSVNPQMWRPEVLALVAAHSAPGARLATFTVAGDVRRGLAANGFAVEKRPGWGRKRERLQAIAPGEPPAERPRPRVAIVGGGVAAAALCRALAAEGVEAWAVAGPDPGASANPAALATPMLDAGEGPSGRLHAQALARAVDLYRRIPQAVLSQGVVRLEAAPRDARRFDAVAASILYAEGAMVRLAPEAAAERLGEPAAAGGLMMTEALVVDPRRVVDAWIGHRIEASVSRLERADGLWRLIGPDGALIAEAEVVCLAAGAGLRTLSDLPLSVVRGQANWRLGIEAGQAATWGGYAAPMAGGVMFGATHDRQDEDLDRRKQDDLRNLAQLARGRPRLAAAVGDRPLEGRASLRAATPDRMPAAGPEPGYEGLYLLGGLGGRGFTTAPLLAEHVAALIVGAPSPLPLDLAAAVDPGRFCGQTAKPSR